MGKRSDFVRMKADFYETPSEAVEPLLFHLAPHTLFYEPCAGQRALVRALEFAGHHCIGYSDIEMDARCVQYPQVTAACFITNPPWTRELLHPIIMNLSAQAETWLLLDADWMHTRQAASYLRRCRQIISIGRVKWIKNSPYVGKDNCCWYKFSSDETEPAVFTPRDNDESRGSETSKDIFGA